MAITDTEITKHFKRSLEDFYAIAAADLGEVTLATLPDATLYNGSFCLVTDASGGRTVCRSDGTDWKVVAVEGATVA